MNKDQATDVQTRLGKLGEKSAAALAKITNAPDWTTANRMALESEHCPVHLLWAHSLARKDRLRATGIVNDNALLFVDELGHRITEARIRVATAAGELLEVQGGST